MFTGLIEAKGTVRRLGRTGSGGRLEVEAAWPHGEPPGHGDSVAVNGACLTVLEPTAGGFAADLSPQTLSLTTLGRLRTGEEVNLERALRLSDRLGGHLVQGHVDEVVRLLSVESGGGFARWRVSVPVAMAREVAPRGSVALHGVSLTVAAVGEGWLEVALIPETLRSTVLGGMRAGASLHLETDVLAKYVVRAVADIPRSALDQLFGDGG